MFRYDIPLLTERIFSIERYKHAAALRPTAQTPEPNGCAAPLEHNNDETKWSCGKYKAA
jgi:hypothetical protein